MEQSSNFRPEKKLYDFTKIDGGKIPESFDLYKSLDERFSRFNSYVGVFPVGSIPFGYSEEYSDADVGVMLDDSVSSFEQDRVEVKKYAKEVNKDAGMRELHLITWTVSEAEIHEAFEAVDLKRIHDVMAPLTLIGKGEKIETYRDCVMPLWLALPKGARDTTREHFGNSTTNQVRKYSGDKISNRQFGRKLLDEQEESILGEQEKTIRNKFSQRFDRLWNLGFDAE